MTTVSQVPCSLHRFNMVQSQDVIYFCSFVNKVEIPVWGCRLGGTGERARIETYRASGFLQRVDEIMEILETKPNLILINMVLLPTKIRKREYFPKITELLGAVSLFSLDIQHYIYQEYLLVTLATLSKLML